MPRLQDDWTARAYLFFGPFYRWSPGYVPMRSSSWRTPNTLAAFQNCALLLLSR